ncbi:MAG: TPM domain-containing protein [Bacteroidales bacterium]|nr:TPM domain-containing protein [Bacteroidales bacterium]
MNELKVKSRKLKGREATMAFLRRFAAAIFFVISFSVSAQDIPARPVPPRLVNDFANVLSAKQEQLLENKLVRFNDTTSTQICVITIDDLGGTTVADFAYQVGEKWGVGHKENNGAVILIKPKKGDEQGDVTIQTGYGLEPFVTDAIARRIIEQVMIPSFKENDYYTAIDKATSVIMGLVSGQFKAEDIEDGGDAEGIAVLLFSIFFIVLLISILGRGNNGGTMSGKGDGHNIWRTLFWLSILNNGSRSSGWGGFSGGSGGYGGGFGGFGGGHFGGGGASGSW